MVSSAFLALLFAIATQTSAPTVEAATLTRTDLIAVAMADATAYNIDIDDFVKTIECESHFNKDAIGDFHHSYGIVQIYLPAHKDISKEDALNPFFALDWAAKQWSQGNQRLWTCYRQLHAAK